MFLTLKAPPLIRLCLTISTSVSLPILLDSQSIQILSSTPSGLPEVILFMHSLCVLFASVFVSAESLPVSSPRPQHSNPVSSFFSPRAASVINSECSQKFSNASTLKYSPPRYSSHSLTPHEITLIIVRVSPPLSSP
jgi:hypothetical protein